MENTLSIFNTQYSLLDILDHSGEKIKADLMALIIWLMEN